MIKNHPEQPVSETLGIPTTGTQNITKQFYVTRFTFK